ncbi:MAG: zinc ribbon domain-containing protein [Planctomycetota bacterium]|jgi:putative FmdB family regulatory protein|nr:zinc ribbon domain-containing protein [Planctomycetota bacterium]
MPTYDYRCNECSHEFEAFQRISEEPLQTCPECEGNVKRLIGAGAGLIFKGSGFYITDYRKAEYKEKAKKESESSSSSDSKSSSNSGSSSGSDSSPSPSPSD